MDGYWDLVLPFGHPRGVSGIVGRVQREGRNSSKQEGFVHGKMGRNHYWVGSCLELSVR